MIAGARRVITAFIAVVVLSGPSEASAVKRVALVMGNSGYQNAARLPNPVRDANAIAVLFRSSGFDVVEARSDLGNLEFKRAVREFTETARSADIAVIFYAGHGIEIGGINYLLPIDAKLAKDYDAEDEAVPLDRMVRALENARCLRLIILDACRDNPFLKTMQRAVALRAVTGGLAKVEPVTSNTLIAYAARAGMTAEDGDGANSPFTAALLKHITQPGLDIQMALRRVRDEVLKQTGNRQEPFIYGSLGGDEIALVAQTSETKSLAVADVRGDYELAAQLGTKQAWESFLNTYKTGFYAELARAQLAKFDAQTRMGARRLETSAPIEREQVDRPGFDRRQREDTVPPHATAERSEPQPHDQIERQPLKIEETAPQRVVTHRHRRHAARQRARDQLPQAQSERAALAEGAIQTALAAPVNETPSASSSVKPTISLTAGTLVREIKKELKRVGCYSGRIDERWSTPDGATSTKKFLRYASLSNLSNEPTQDLLDTLRGKSDRVCPLACTPRQVERNGRCIAKTCPHSYILNDRGGCDRKREERSKTAARSSPTTRPLDSGPSSGSSRSIVPPKSDREPGAGMVRTGTSMLVDDGTCPRGQIKEIFGGSLKHGVPRTRTCVPRR
jgi:hypothetical protein